MVYGQTKWGWGRIKPELDEVIASQKFPWKLIYALIIVLPIYLVYYFLGLEFGKFSFLLHIIVTVVLALPIFGLVIVACSHLHGSKTAPFDASKIKYQDASFESTWKGKKVPIETLYEAFFAEKISFEGDLLEALRDRYHFAHFGFTLGHLKYFFGQLIPELLVHSKAQDTDQVQDHYDRGNDFYRAFLGPLMVYTSGIFENPEDTLEVAQMNKIEGIFDKIHLKKGDRLLDLGCGWGTFVVEAAKRGANPTGVTLAKEQTKWANDLIKEAGIKANILNMDYRDVPREQGVYDKITCLEMAEHVGVKLFPSFLQQVKYMLKDDGIFYLQIAGLRRPWQYEDLCWGMFMGKYVFPGADASCPLAWVIDQLEGAGFEVHRVDTIGVHYSATINRWYNNWLEHKDQIINKYGVQWYRKWEWFLAWSTIVPEQGSASCYQIVCHKNTRKFDRKALAISEMKNA